MKMTTTAAQQTGMKQQEFEKLKIAGCAAKRRQVPLRRSGKGRMNLREPRRQNKQGAVAGGSTEGVTPFFGPAALTTGFKIPTLCGCHLAC